MGAIGNFIDPLDPTSAENLPVNRFQALAAGAGKGPTDLAEQDYNQLINNAIAQQAGVNGTQNALVSSLQAQANGTGGPNLAQQQLQNATNQNIQSQAGAVAGLRGLNPAMAQRLIAGQGAALQQGAAGQSAELRMQQQLAAQQQLGNVLAQQAQANQGQLGTGAGALGQQNQTNLANQQGAQSLNAQAAGQNANLRSAANGQSLGLTQTGGQTAGALTSAAGTLGVAALASKGALVPGRSPYPDGDPRTDTKPYLLAPGEVVVPAKIADDPEAAAAFVAAIKKHRGANRKGK